MQSNGSCEFGELWCLQVVRSFTGYLVAENNG